MGKYSSETEFTSNTLSVSRQVGQQNVDKKACGDCERRLKTA